MFSTRWESRGYRISFVACRAEALAKAGQGFAVVTTALPLTPRIFSILNFCNVKVYPIFIQERKLLRVRAIIPGFSRIQRDWLCQPLLKDIL
jgi:hypothetical protein